MRFSSITPSDYKQRFCPRKINQPMKRTFRSKVLIGSVLIDNVDWPGAIRRVEELIKEDRPAFVTTPNVDHVITAESDEHFRTIYRQADLVLADGVPIIWASKFLGTPIKEKISGSDFLVRFCPVAAEKGYRLFFLGGVPTAAEISADILSKKYPGLKVVGTSCPPLGFHHDRESNARVVEEIKKAAPDIVFVGLGAPKQEKWIFQNKETYRAPVSFTVGASFDFVAGITARAPLTMQKIGLEWFWRLLKEPRKLWKRYLIKDMKFFPLIIRQKRRRAADFAGDSIGKPPAHPPAQPGTD